MIDLTKLKNKTTLDKVRNYSGTNDHILKMKKRLDSEGFFVLTPSQTEYIQENIEREPIDVNKVVDIAVYLGEQLKEKHTLKNIPERVYVEKLLAESDKSYHVKGKLYKNQKESILFYLPKTQIHTDMFEENLDDIIVDFEKYRELDEKHRIPFKHQEIGIKFLIKKLKCILADDMGLGKTYQSIVAALETGVDKVLIICPANAKINWKRELMNFVDEDDISIIKSGYWNPKKFTIINYDILSKFHTIIDGRKKYEEHEIKRFLVDEGYDLVIMDEAHFIKNPKAQRSKIAIEISENISRRWLLSGTPVANRPMDYFNLLHLCGSSVTANWQFYAFRYCAAKKFRRKGTNKFIWVTDGASNLDELHMRTKNLILRRKKEDHLDLPPKIVSPYYIEIDDMDQYGRVFDEYLEWAKSEGKNLGAGRHMVELVVLRKYLAQEKVKHTVELAEQAIENGQKVIIFTSFTDSFNLLMNHFGKLAVGHNGKMNEKQKQNSIDQFQENPEVMVFVGNLISAGSAITLTAAQIVIMNDLDFVPSNHAQAEDRAYRIGQDKTVNVYYPIADNTLDVQIYNILQKKKDIINTVMGEETHTIDISEDIIHELIKLVPLKKLKL
jgi:SWI/SNF-related matrix-associated actin-dependent regulator 1 of chromatin subfamily A